MADDRTSGSSNRKRSFFEDDGSNKAPAQKRVRFPKGKKVKSGDYVVDEEARPTAPTDPRLAAKDRAVRRNQITVELFDEDNRGICDDILQAEVHYEDDETFIDDGIPIEPFNLSQEREEGYFDADGNYVEYVNQNEKDAWLDSVEVDYKFAAKQPIRRKEEDNGRDEAQDLSSDDIGKIKRKIADVLEPGETVLLALRRLKGTSNKKEKMSAETKLLFDQLTEDAMKLLENGDYDVYNEKQENFQREAEGYERLAQARRQVISMNSGVEKSDNGVDKDLDPNGTEMASSSTLFDTDAGPPKLNNNTTTRNDDDSFDMFAEDDENATVNLASGGSRMGSYHGLENQNQPPEGKDLQNDYVYDESSGYYYSSSSGYYYDPSSGLFCCAASGQWYSYNEGSGTYEEIPQAASNAS